MKECLFCGHVAYDLYMKEQNQKKNIYIVIQRQTVSFYYNYSVRLNPQDASTWDRNPSNFTLDFVSYRSAI